LGRVPLPASRAVAKRRSELGYWRTRLASEGGLHSDHYEQFFTTHFGLTPEDYAGKRILDVGCGPRGSLDWAGGAAERIGLDPLADVYRKLAPPRGMDYVAGVAEDVPFPDGYFDIVSSFNSLDHVDTLEKAVSELGRVTRAQGRLLLLTDVGHAPTFSEPQAFSWDVLDLFRPEWEVLREHRYERRNPNMMSNLQAAKALDPGADGPGVLSALLRRR
jgi:SAM-dependent methyltransferase